MVTAAARELADTNVRVNEAFLNARVEYDEDAEQKGESVIKASDYGKLYANILEGQDLKGYRISCFGPKDLDAGVSVKKRDQLVKRETAVRYRKGEKVWEGQHFESILQNECSFKDKISLYTLKMSR